MHGTNNPSMQQWEDCSGQEDQLRQERNEAQEAHRKVEKENSQLSSSLQKARKTESWFCEQIKTLQSTLREVREEKAEFDDVTQHISQEAVDLENVLCHHKIHLPTSQAHPQPVLWSQTPANQVPLFMPLGYKGEYSAIWNPPHWNNRKGRDWMRWGYYANHHIKYLDEQRKLREHGGVPAEISIPPWNDQFVLPFVLPVWPHVDRPDPDAHPVLMAPAPAAASVTADVPPAPAHARRTLFQHAPAFAHSEPNPPRLLRPLNLGFRAGIDSWRGRSRGTLNAPSTLWPIPTPRSDHEPELDFLCNDLTSTEEITSFNQLHFLHDTAKGAWLHMCNRGHALKQHTLSINWHKLTWYKEAKGEKYEALLRRKCEQNQAQAAAAEGLSEDTLTGTTNAIVDEDTKMNDSENIQNHLQEPNPSDHVPEEDVPITGENTPQESMYLSTASSYVSFMEPPIFTVLKVKQ
ncbi:uncharacterized protein PHACADRAFT_201739 [Phanerochaete carnosa HHB-10118-sp]|uniref:Uncharacterized protein n=1 Tax=Phanerochaete carnosa (strain HHB-10118-sp) TaxID=650164 RepID=K5VRI3_PHACS|nr:uncharacterized protein PHACADRAFT_201739 [Phanerochaete carnosa HHB-10118-sp]EKM49350.1 hypothetical protein PHACADRAFT_201739 [Phanerochaete carnosa HHB-10118-sp]